jgi:hypothetical protein
MFIHLSFQLHIADDTSKWVKSSVVSFLKRPVHIDRTTVVDWIVRDENILVFEMKNVHQANTIRVLREFIKRYEHLRNFFGSGIQLWHLVQIIAPPQNEFENIRNVERPITPVNIPFTVKMDSPMARRRLIGVKE